jgi:LysM repeat protein
MRAWTKSACLVLAWSILAFFVVAVGLSRPVHLAQANTSTLRSSSEVSRFDVFSSTGQVVLASMNTTAAPETSRPGVRYVVRAGDTLSGIAAEFGVRGGWPALYAANRRVIGADPDVIRAGTVVVVPGGLVPVRYTVAAGDSLSAIAARFGVRGGWPALFAANRHAVGGNPDVVRAGIVLTIPRPPVVAPPPAVGSSHHRRHHPAVPQPPVRPTPAQHPVPAPARHVPVTTGMPGWLRTTLLAVGLLIAAAFVTEPVLAARRRRHRAQTAAAAGQTVPAGPGPQPGAAQPGTPGPVSPETATPETGSLAPGAPETGTPEAAVPVAASAGTGSPRSGPRRARGRTHIVLADHDRLVVTRSQHDDMVYVLRPPGADPKAILRVASLVLPECRYGELAEQLGVPATWPME